MTDSKTTCEYMYSTRVENFSSVLEKRVQLKRLQQSLSPIAIAIDNEEYVYISKSNLGVSIFDKEGSFIKAFGANLKGVKAIECISTAGEICMFVKAGIIVCQSSLGLNEEENFIFNACTITDT